MTEPYETPPSLVDAEQRLNEALNKLKQNLDGVEELSGIVNAFSDASDANKATVAAFLEASRSFEKSSAATLEALKSLAQSIEDNQSEFDEAIGTFDDDLSKIRGELNRQNKKINLLMLLSFVPIVLIAILLFLSFSTWQ